jgi:beta-phosphoglucomutase-like phosphatase (HAD superfamily)
LAFEDSLAGASASTRAGIETVVIWDGSEDQKSYPHEVIYFFPDFTGLAGNLDKDPLTLIQEFSNSINPPAPQQ